MNIKKWLLLCCLMLILLLQIKPVTESVSMTLGKLGGFHSSYTETVWHTETIPVALPARLEAETSGGFITVSSHDQNEITIHISVKKDGRYLSEGEEVPVEVNINEDTHSVEIDSRVTGRSRWFRIGPGITISYRIYVPRQTEVHAKTSGGSVTASDIDHPVSLITSGGPVTVSNVTGDVLARTSGGPISISDVIGNVTARTTGGGIRVTDASGKMNLRTSGGPINLTHLSGSIEARTSGGSISADIVSLQEHLTLKTSGGSISVTLPSDQGMDISTSGSYVHNRLDDLTGILERGSMKGSVKGGGIPVDIHTSGGTVTLEYGNHVTTDLTPPVRGPF